MYDLQVSTVDQCYKVFYNFYVEPVRQLSNESSNVNDVTQLYKETWINTKYPYRLLDSLIEFSNSCPFWTSLSDNSRGLANGTPDPISLLAASRQPVVT